MRRTIQHWSVNGQTLLKAIRDWGQSSHWRLSEGSEAQGEEKVLNFSEEKDTMHQIGPDIPSLPMDTTKKKGRC